MINYDLPWNPNRLQQQMGRIHGIGQERAVLSKKLSSSKYNGILFDK